MSSMPRPRYSRPSFSVLFFGAVLASCRSRELGTAPEELVDLYDRAAPEGVIELEIERDGAIREMEAEIPIGDLPARVREAALAEAPGALIVGAERELQREGEFFEVQLWHEGRDWEYIVDEHGRIQEVEKKLHRFEHPRAILAAADAALPGGALKSVESVEHASRGTVYHVKKERDGASYKLVISPGGEVQRIVREARAEIEIPLQGK